ncbi:hypothetical protein NDU88_005484 [Pleurodeles waltl]|uniref:Uncharacterized protein n=1 Tax=Pleurodeles waltl TaxID=8319 RepID=A0AAV7TUE9_PLEWA|nr:hypothetical protein NDU88_005484 [Pleurodeles waltl]
MVQGGRENRPNRMTSSPIQARIGQRARRSRAHSVYDLRSRLIAASMCYCLEVVCGVRRDRRSQDQWGCGFTLRGPHRVRVRVARFTVVLYSNVREPIDVL